MLLFRFSDTFVSQYAGSEIAIVGVNGILGVKSDATIVKVSPDQLREKSRIPPGIKWTVIRIDASTFALRYSGHFNYFLSIGSVDNVVTLRKNISDNETFTLASDPDNYGIRRAGPKSFLSISGDGGILSTPNFAADEKFQLFVVF